MRRNHPVATILFQLVLLTLAAFAIGSVAGAGMGQAWNWIVPDVFGGAVKQGVLPAHLSVVHALKLALLIPIMGLTMLVILWLILKIALALLDWR